VGEGRKVFSSLLLVEVNQRKGKVLGSEKLGQDVDACNVNISAISSWLTENTPRVHYKTESVNSVQAISKECTASNFGGGG
jgi:hypothetical protein